MGGFVFERVQFEGKFGFQAPIGPRRMFPFFFFAKQKMVRASGILRLPVNSDNGGDECASDGRMEGWMSQRERNWK